MSDKDLTIFERRFEGWSVAHPRRSTPATGKEAVANFISAQTDKIVSAQLKAADRIIVSQDRIASGIGKVALGIDRVADGLEGLASAFDWGFSEMIWQLEQQRTVLEEILTVLQAPLDTQAEELRKRAEDAYRNGWIDDALKDFLESENKNRYDFTIHQSLGNIYLFHKKIPEKALEYYEKAVKYAKPKSSYHASFALLHVGLTRYLQEDFQKAYEATLETIELSPNLYEAHYQCAQYCANLGKYDEAINHLWVAIQGDRNYCLKADSEKDFDVMRKQLQSFLENLRNKAQSKAEAEIGKAQELIVYAESYGLSVSGESNKFRTANKKQSEAEEFLRKASLLGCWDAIDKAWDVQELVLDSLEGYLSGQILQLEKEYNEEEARLEQRTDFWVRMPVWFFAGALVLLFIGTVIAQFVRGQIAEGVLLLIFGSIGFGILIGLGGVQIFGLGRLISWPICHFVAKKHQTRYESKLAKLHNKLSEVKTKRSQLNWEYKQQKD